MTKRLVGTGVVAALIALLVGFVWWGLPARRLESDLKATQTRAEDLGRAVDDLRTQLATERARLVAAERHLRTEQAMNAKLQLLVSEGRK